MADQLENKLVRLEVQMEVLTKNFHDLRNDLMKVEAPANQVTSLDRQVGKLENAIEKLSAKIDERTKFPWAPVLSAIGLLWTISSSSLGGWIVYNNSQNVQDINRLERIIDGMGKNLVPRDEIAALRDASKERVDKLADRVGKLEQRR